jgi:hypothetical protein
MVYSTSSTIEFNFGSFVNNRTALLQKVASLQYNSYPAFGSTATHFAFRRMRTELLAAKDLQQQPTGFRGNTNATACVLITDGAANSPSSVALEAAKLRQSGVELFALGVGSYDYTQLLTIASAPTSEHVTTLAAFADLGTSSFIDNTLLSLSCGPVLRAWSLDLVANTMTLVFSKVFSFFSHFGRKECTPCLTYTYAGVFPPAHRIWTCGHSRRSG